MKVAIIPARGGSKRIPRKNIKLFHGKPIIAYSIEAAKKSKLFDNIIVSTDNNEIAEVARRYGAETPFIRPANISDDYTGTNDVVEHAVQFLLKESVAVDYVCCLYATAPFISAETIQQGFVKLQREPEALYCFTVTSFPFPIQRAISITEDDRVLMREPEHYETRSQDLVECYHDAGQMYWGRLSGIMENQPYFSEHSIPLILPRDRVQDIDTPEDWRRAEYLYKFINQ